MDSLEETITKTILVSERNWADAGRAAFGPRTLNPLPESFDRLSGGK